MRAGGLRSESTVGFATGTGSFYCEGSPQSRAGFWTRAPAVRRQHVVTESLWPSAQQGEAKTSCRQACGSSTRGRRGTLYIIYGQANNGTRETRDRPYNLCITGAKKARTEGFCSCTLRFCGPEKSRSGVAFRQGPRRAVSESQSGTGRVPRRWLPPTEIGFPARQNFPVQFSRNN